MLIKIYSQGPSERELAAVVDHLQRDGVVIYPTDSVYAFGCSLHSPKAIERISRIKGKGEAEFSILFASLSQIANYCLVDNVAFKLLKRNLPGAFTFLLPVSSRIPDKALERRRTVGVRIPDNAIARAIVERLDCPMITTSVKSDDGETEYTTDPSLIEERYGALVDVVVDGGIGDCIPTTVVDLTDDDVRIVREGRGELQF